MLHGYQCYDIFQANTEFEYKMMANVTIIPDVTSSTSNQANSQWTLSGILRVQRVDEGSIALKVGRVIYFHISSNLTWNSSLCWMKEPTQIMQQLNH